MYSSDLSDRPLRPWKFLDEVEAQKAAVIRSTVAYRDELMEENPWIPFPQHACCYSFGPDECPLPIGALLLLWEEWPACTGTCPNCGGAAYGYAFGGLLSVGGVPACCVSCERGLFRQVGELAAVAELVRAYLLETPYRLKSGRFGATFPGPRRPLYAALRALGATDLPNERWASGADEPGVELRIQR